MKKLITSIFLLAIVLSLDAQEIEPSLQAQGYLDSKEATVDYSVGLFGGLYITGKLRLRGARGA